MPNPYPSHIYDPLRRKIAEDYLSHEFRKFFSTINDEQTWVKIDNEIRTWFNSHHTFAPIRDFWNGVHGISRGFKLKNIVSWLTSENIEWSEDMVEIDKFHFGVNFQEFKHLSLQPSVKEVQDFIQKLPADEFQKMKDNHFNSQKHVNDVDHFPIFAVERDNKFIVSDGNRRLFGAILQNVTTIKAAVGKKIQSPIVYNEWVPTSTLQDLVALVRKPDTNEQIPFDAIAEVVTSMIKNSESGKYEFFERSVNINEKTDKRLISLVEKKLYLHDIKSAREQVRKGEVKSLAQVRKELGI